MFPGGTPALSAALNQGSVVGLEKAGRVTRCFSPVAWEGLGCLAWPIPAIFLTVDRTSDEGGARIQKSRTSVATAADVHRGSASSGWMRSRASCPEAFPLTERH